MGNMDCVGRQQASPGIKYEERHPLGASNGAHQFMDQHIRQFLKGYLVREAMHYGQKSPQLRGLIDSVGVCWKCVWWRRRGLNPRPQILRLRLYMLIRLFGFNRTLPERQGGRPTIPVLFSASTPEELQRELTIELPPQQQPISGRLCRG